jgi:hypothetical protein
LLMDETDRGCALIGGAMVDEALRDILVTYFEPGWGEKLLDHGPRAPLSDFSVRIKMARALGIVDADLFSDLDVVRTTRNEAAHFEKRRGAGFSVSFDERSVADRLCNLKSLSPSVRTAGREAPRALFEVFAGCAYAGIMTLSMVIKNGMRLGKGTLSHARRYCDENPITATFLAGRIEGMYEQHLEIHKRRVALRAKGGSNL